MSIINDQLGKPSAMRVGLIASLAVGSILCIAGAYGVFKSIDDAINLVSIGAMLIGGSQAAKVGQSWSERNANYQVPNQQAGAGRYRVDHRGSWSNGSDPYWQARPAHRRTTAEHKGYGVGRESGPTGAQEADR